MKTNFLKKTVLAVLLFAGLSVGSASAQAQTNIALDFGDQEVGTTALQNVDATVGLLNLGLNPKLTYSLTGANADQFRVLNAQDPGIIANLISALLGGSFEVPVIYAPDEEADHSATLTINLTETAFGAGDHDWIVTLTGTGVAAAPAANGVNFASHEVNTITKLTTEKLSIAPSILGIVTLGSVTATIEGTDAAMFVGPNNTLLGDIPELLKQLLAGGLEIPVIYAPTETGDHEAFLRVKVNLLVSLLPTTQEYLIPLTGTATASTVEMPVFNFGDQILNTPRTEQVSVKLPQSVLDILDLGLTVGDVKVDVTGTDAAMFTANNSGLLGNVVEIITDLLAGLTTDATIEVPVTYTPATETAHSATLKVTLSVLVDGLLSTDQVVLIPLAGTGDATAPYITNNPTDGGIAVDVTQPITIEYNEDLVLAADAEDAFRQANSNYPDATVSVVDNELTITLGEPTSEEANVTVTIPAGLVSDTAGNATESADQFTFSTEDKGTGIGNAQAGKVEASSEIYTLTGVRVSEDATVANNIYVKKVVYTDGTTAVVKFVK
jgi:hypothetical protein